MTAIQRFALHGTIMNPHSSGPYIRHEDHLAAMRGRCLAKIEEPAGAAPAAVAGPAMDVTLDEDQAGLLRDMLGDREAYPEAITVRLLVGDGHSGHGLYVAQAEYQDEGAVLLASLPAPAAPALEAPAAPAVEALRALMSLVRREAPHLSGKVMGEADAILAGAALVAAPQAPAQDISEIDWDVLPENPGERVRFDRQLTQLYGGDPRVSISTALRLWAETPSSGFFGAQCAVFANEVAKMHIAAPALEAPVAPMSTAEACVALAINSALHRIRTGNAAGAIEPLEQARAALAAAPQAPAGEPYAYEVHAPDEPALGSILIYKKDLESYVGDGWVVKHTLRTNAEAPAAPAVDALSQAARDVLAERRRQIESEGFSPERDDQYVGGQLAGAATSYLILAAGGREDEARAFWPWRQEWLKPGSQRRYLEKACALGLAEMERMDRSAALANGGNAI